MNAVVWWIIGCEDKHVLIARAGEFRTITDGPSAGYTFLHRTHAVFVGSIEEQHAVAEAAGLLLCETWAKSHGYPLIGERHPLWPEFAKAARSRTHHLGDRE